MKLVDITEKGTLPAFGDKITQSRVVICLYQACFRTLLGQDDDGSSNSLFEGDYLRDPHTFRSTATGSFPRFQ
ncbi:hypothetical protein F4775DRAFT_570972 [Biscogniauxia sp. FL1348]|nr:hypothetical protein F4775DRAFT_570972 [Biscogniauxia sp. FL1348]